MDDYISRQATIEALKKAIPSLSTPDGTGAYDVELQSAAEAFVDAIQIVNSIKSSQVIQLATGKKIHTKKHKWAREKNGEIDFFAWFDGYCNGPLCVECGEHFCIHCVEREGGEEVVNEKLKAETCEERIVCSICGREVPEDAPYCNCGAMMMEE